MSDLSETAPAVTVLLPVFNGWPHLPEAVASILDQTFVDFELLIVDDGSTDETPAYLDSLRDPRVRIIRQANAGLVASLNRGLREAKGSLIARMDADDVCAPDRLAAQCALLETRPAVVAVGCCYDVIDASGAVRAAVHLAAAADYLHRQLYLRNVFAHAAMMLRRSAVIELGGYRDVGPVEDYDLWCRLAARHPLANVPEPLLRYRVVETGISASNRQSQLACFEAVRARVHEETPLLVPSAREIVRQGDEHVRTYRRTCRGTEHWYAYDHFWLAVLVLRRRRWLAAARLFAATAAFVGRHPRGLTGIPPLTGLWSHLRTSRALRLFRARAVARGLQN